MVMGNLQNKKEGDKQKNKEKMKNIQNKINSKNVEKLEVLGNFKRKKKWERG
jgi:hypothetical protein